jgi:hypothetical protein
MNQPSALILLLVLTLSGPTCVRAAQDAGDEVLTNESIAAMTKGGLSPSVIVLKVRASKTDFDVDSAELIRLKQEGVADEVIAAMLEASGATATASATPSERTRLRRTQPASGPAPPDPAYVPAPPPESGIYLAKGTGSETELVLLEPSVFIQSKETGVWKQRLTYGIAKVRYKAVLLGAQARLQVDTRRPVFYFYFDVTSVGLSSAGTVWGPTTSANEFVLAKMDRKKSSRELAVGEHGDYTGTQHGVSEKAMKPFKSERLAPGVYRVTVESDLPDGEYCFFYAGTAAAAGAGGGPKLFDFTVKAPGGSRAKRRGRG